MDSSSKPDPEVVFDFSPLIRVYKDGHVERLIDTDFVPPSTDPKTGVSAKDITIIPESNVSARIFLPKLTNPNKKLPLLVYFHGGAFCVSTPFAATYNSLLNALVAEANVVAVSVDYRLAPEHPIPAAYEDSWAALQWVLSHCNSEGPEPWLNEHADFERVFLGGVSSGANIAHNLAIVAGDPEYGLNVPLLGIALVHPLFWGSEPIGSEALDPDRKAVMDKLWPFLCPSDPDNDDPRINPVAGDGPGLSGLGCKRVLVCVAEKDEVRDRGWLYYEALGRSGWLGVVEIMETEGKGHGFHLHDLESKEAKDLISRLAAFYNRDIPYLF
ncbi:Alpha/beta hydrolase-3 [Corchorus olitorius]|uniref:Alpha/beta hydrolase-3 n=1 Tax=Corchorus olitorius TaxID=93759 RepID=A0A1R3HX35_9ROSI|nr:Alpha/beta hydrolase-3 [Corchorus olitorius]